MKFFDVFIFELKQVFTDTAVVLTIIAGVIFYSFLYPQPYAKQSVSSLSVSLIDFDKTDVSRDIAYKLNSTPQITIARFDNSQKQAKEALLRGDVKAIIIIPSNFKKDLILQKSPTIAIGADSSYFLILGAVLEGAMKSILTQGVIIKVANLLKKGVPVSSAKEAYMPYSLNTINLFNKDNSYTQYVVPAVFILILQQTMLIGMGILGGGVNEKMKTDKKYTKAKTYQIILSRYIIFGTLFFIHMLFYFGFSFSNFGITHISNINNLLMFGISFLAASLSFGVFLGSVLSSREIATPIILFSSLPLVFSVGFIWPKELIPEFVYYLSLLSPSTPAIKGFLSLNQMGASFDMVISEFSLLWVQTIFYTVLGFYFMQRRKNLYK